MPRSSRWMATLAAAWAIASAPLPSEVATISALPSADSETNSLTTSGSLPAWHYFPVDVANGVPPLVFSELIELVAILGGGPVEECFGRTIDVRKRHDARKRQQGLRFGRFHFGNNQPQRIGHLDRGGAEPVDATLFRDNRIGGRSTDDGMTIG